VLCLVTDHEDPGLVKRLASLFETLAPGGVFLDVAFLNEAQEVDVARVCSAFYRR